jgi:hypothetical protein
VNAAVIAVLTVIWALVLAALVYLALLPVAQALGAL